MSKTMTTERKTGQKTALKFLGKLAILVVCAVIWRLLMPVFGVTPISSFLSYTMVLVLMTATLEVILSPLKRKANEDIGNSKYRAFYHTARTLVGAVAYIVYFASADAVMTQLFGWGTRGDVHYGLELQQLPRIIPFLLSMIGMSWFMRNTFRPYSMAGKSAGMQTVTQVVEAVALTGLAVLLFGVCSVPMTGALVVVLCLDGILLTLVTIISACKASAVVLAVKHYFYYALFAGGNALVFYFHNLHKSFGNQWKEMAINGAFGLLFALAVCAIILIVDGNFRRGLKAKK